MLGVVGGSLKLLLLLLLVLGGGDVQKGVGVAVGVKRLRGNGLFGLAKHLFIRKIFPYHL